MHIRDLKLLNFRNYEKLNINFHPSLNIFCGKNGVGKTNLVEAIYVLALTRSFRTSSDKNLILKGKQLSKVEGNIVNRYENNFQLVISSEGKKVKVDGNKITKISDYISKINIILFHPNDLKFVRDTPNIRRKLINIDISQLKLTYLKDLNHYNKLMKQRNAYLKQRKSQNMTFIDILTDKLIEYGQKINKERQNFIDLINQNISQIYENITGTKNLILRYESDFNNKSKEELLDDYKKALDRDIFHGKTRIGIHADDFIFILDEDELKSFGSEGQQKNAIIALKFAELEIFKKLKGYYPILILDDLFSELDQEKIKHILLMLRSEIQTFITTANIENLSSVQLSNHQQISIDENHNLEVINNEQ